MSLPDSADVGTEWNHVYKATGTLVDIKNKYVSFSLLIISLAKG